MEENNIILVGGEGKVSILETTNSMLNRFLRSVKKIYSEGLPPGLPPETVKEIELKSGGGQLLKFAHIYSIFSLAGEKKRPEIFYFMKKLQKKYSCQYLILKIF